jgi:hypothetical protein
MLTHWLRNLTETDLDFGYEPDVSGMRFPDFPGAGQDLGVTMTMPQAIDVEIHPGLYQILSCTYGRISSAVGGYLNDRQQKSEGGLSAWTHSNLNWCRACI